MLVINCTSAFFFKCFTDVANFFIAYKSALIILLCLDFIMREVTIFYGAFLMSFINNFVYEFYRVCFIKYFKTIIPSGVAISSSQQDKIQIHLFTNQFSYILNSQIYLTFKLTIGLHIENFSIITTKVYRYNR